MLHLLRLVFVICATFLVSPNTAQAIEISCLGPKVASVSPFDDGIRYMHIGISGSFEKGDFAKLQTAMTTFKNSDTCKTAADERYDPNKPQVKKEYIPGYVFELNSQGGNFAEAMDIANYVVDTFTGTYVGPNSECLSACALVFMAGIRHVGDGDWFPSRHMHYTAKVGLHSPFVPAIDLSGLPPEVLRDVLDTTYSEAIDSASRLTVLAMKARWKPGFVNVVLRTPPDTFLFVDTFGKVGGWSVILEGLDVPPDTSTEALWRACINYHFWRDENAGLDIEKSDVFDPEKPLSPTRAEYEEVFARIANGQMFAERKPGQYGGEDLRFTNDWDGDWCNFNISDTGEVSGVGLNGQGFKTLHLIPSHLRIDDVVSVPPARTRNGIDLLADTSWNHNGSLMRSFIRADGLFEIHYAQPRSGLQSIGITAGTPLIIGQIDGDTINAAAWLFSSSGCPNIQYRVTGTVSEMARGALMLRGEVPVRDANCNFTGTRSDGGNANLQFNPLQ